MLCRVGRLDADSGGKSLDVSFCAPPAYRTSGFRIGLCIRDTGMKCMCRRRILSRSNLGTRGRGLCSDDSEAAFSPCGIAKHAFACCAPVAARCQCLLPSLIAFNAMIAEEWVCLRYLGKRMRGDRLAIVHAADASRPLSLRSHFLIQVASILDAEVDSATHPFCFALQIAGSA